MLALQAEDVRRLEEELSARAETMTHLSRELAETAEARDVAVDELGKCRYATFEYSSWAVVFLRKSHSLIGVFSSSSVSFQVDVECDSTLKNSLSVLYSSN
jgi:hypothetical protein